MWFVLGVLCGVAVGCCRPRRKPPLGKTETMVQKPSKEWGETRNFLYYDGTEMPVVKEDLNE